MKGVLFIICTLCGTVFGQDLKTEIAAMHERLAGLENYRLTVRYAAGDTADFFDQGNASVLVTPQGYFYQTDFAEMIINQQHTFIINEEERTLIYSDNVQHPKKTVALNESILQGIDTLIATADSVYFTPNGDQQVYHLRFKNSYFNLVELTFKGNYLQKVLYFYNEAFVEQAGMTAVCYMEVDEHPEYDKALLLSDYYIHQTNGGVVPSESFTGYVLVYNETIESYTE